MSIVFTLSRNGPSRLTEDSMKTRHMLNVVMGAVLMSGTFVCAQQNNPQGPGPCSEGQGMRPPCEGQCQEGAGMRRGGPGQEGGTGMMQGRRSEGMGSPGMQRGGSEGGPKGLPDPKRLKEAGVTDQQLEALKKFEDEQQLKRIDLKAAVEKAEVTFSQLMRSETTDEAAALKAADALSQARAEAFKADIAAQLKVRSILGADVLKKMREMGPPERMNRPDNGPRPDSQQQKDAPPAGDRPQHPEQK